MAIVNMDDLGLIDPVFRRHQYSLPLVKDAKDQGDFMENKNQLKGRYLHHKGKYYDVLGEAYDVNSNISYIIYRQDYGHKHWWIRPKDMFFQEIEIRKEIQFRFLRVDDKINIPEVKTRSFLVRHTETGVQYSAKYKHIYGKYLLFLENEYEQLEFELYPTIDFLSVNE